MRAFLNKEFPEAALVSEWGKPEVALEAGFDMDFYLHFGDTGYMDLFRGDHPYFGGDPESDISVFAGSLQKSGESAGKGMMCMPSGNHDILGSLYQLDEEQMRLAYGFIYGFRGAPFLYYGDEIGMRYIPDMISVEGGYERTGSSRTPDAVVEGSQRRFFQCTVPDVIYGDGSGQRPSGRGKPDGAGRQLISLDPAADRTQKSVSLLWK